jgi:hypothetical protein
MYGQSRYNIEDIKFRIQKNAGYTADELVCLLEQDRPTRLEFMVLNNPGNVNETLKYKLGDNTLSFKPDIKAIQSHVDLLIQKGDAPALDTIEKNFKLDTSNVASESDKELQAILKKYLPNWF